MFKWAKKAVKVAHNLALEVEYVNKGSEGHHTWTVDELEQYEAHHPVGTKARLGLDLVQFLGLARMDGCGSAQEHSRRDERPR